MAKSGRELKRLYHPPEVWAVARKDWLAGFTATAIEDRHGIPAASFRVRMRLEGLQKRRQVKHPGLSLADEAAANAAAKAAQAQAAEEAAEAARAAGREFNSNWLEIAHDAQRPPDGAWATWLFQGGRGAGKTRAGAEWLAERAEKTPGGRFALVGATLGDVREVMVDGPAGLGSLPGRAPVRYEPSRRRVVWDHNGAVAHCFTAEEPERLRGPQFEAAWADEFCAWPRPAETLALLRMGLRLGSDPRLVITTTPKPIAALRKLKVEGSLQETRAATHTNAANLAPAFLDMVLDLYGGTRLAAQELDGVMVEAAEGALWRAADLAACQGAVPPALDKVVVAVDPPASANDGGAACGIVVAGRRFERAYVLADRSAKGLSPLGWAREVARAAAEFGAGAVVAEANQGGEMVRSVLASAGVAARIRLVHASRGKRARAEPVAALYEQGRVAHCAAMPRLEEEMLALGGGDLSGEGGSTLDRADALVWAITSLMLEDRPAPRVRWL